MINELHEKIFQALEEFRKHHTDFIYITRTDKNKDKLDAGLWFLGGENYVWVSWIKRSHNMNHSPALRLLLKNNSNGISCTVENGYKMEKEPEVIKLYEQARDVISNDYGLMSQKGDNYYFLELDQINGIDALIGFLAKTKPKLDILVSKMRIEKILLTREVFQERLELTAVQNI